MAIADPEITLLDEPTSSLDYHSIKQLRELIGLWKSRGKTVIVSEHRLWFIWDLADRMLLFRNGLLKSEYGRKEMNRLFDSELAKLGLRSVSAGGCDPSVPCHPEFLPGDSFYEIKDFYARNGGREYRIPQIRFAKGAITAITAPNGNGKSTLLHCLAGILKFRAEINTPSGSLSRKEFCRSWFMVFQDPNYQLCRETVEDELRISFPKETPKELVRIGISEILKDLELSGTEDRHPLSLSGVQKLRLAIGCAIASRRNLLLDEPTSGLDYANMKALSILLKKLSAEKKITVIVVTHDVEFIYSCCNRHIQLAYKQS